MNQWRVTSDQRSNRPGLPHLSSGLVPVPVRKLPWCPFTPSFFTWFLLTEDKEFIPDEESFPNKERGKRKRGKGRLWCVDLDRDVNNVRRPRLPVTMRYLCTESGGRPDPCSLTRRIDTVDFHPVCFYRLFSVLSWSRYCPSPPSSQPKPTLVPGYT